MVNYNKNEYKTPYIFTAQTQCCYNIDDIEMISESTISCQDAG